MLLLILGRKLPCNHHPTIVVKCTDTHWATIGRSVFNDSKGFGCYRYLIPNGTFLSRWPSLAALQGPLTCWMCPNPWLAAMLPFWKGSVELVFFEGLGEEWS